MQEGKKPISYLSGEANAKEKEKASISHFDVTAEYEEKPTAYRMMA